MGTTLERLVDAAAGQYRQVDVPPVSYDWGRLTDEYRDRLRAARRAGDAVALSAVLTELVEWPLIPAGLPLDVVGPLADAIDQDATEKERELIDRRFR